MTLYTNTAEGGTAGAAVTAGNSGGASGDAFALIQLGGAATVTYSATGKAHGNLGIRCQSAGGASDKFYVRRTLPTLSGVLAERFYLVLNALPSQAQDIYHVDNVGSRLFAVGLLAGNIMRVVSATGATLGQWNTVLTAGTVYRVEAQWKKGTTTSDGQLAVQLFAGESTTPLYSYSATNVNVGTADAQHVYYGDGTTPRISDITFDTMATQDSQAAIGPVTAANVPPTANAGPDQTVDSLATVTLDSSASADTDGTITRTWAQTGGTAVTLSSTTATKPTFAAPADPAGATLTFQLTVTDDKAATATDTVVVTVRPHVEWLKTAGGLLPLRRTL